jgi:hypothetical protein
VAAGILLVAACEKEVLRGIHVHVPVLVETEEELALEGETVVECFQVVVARQTMAD